MVKKIKHRRNCKLHGHRWMQLCNIITGIRKKEQVIEVPGEPNVEVVYNYLLQCDVCKIIATPEISKERLESAKESQLPLPIVQ